MVGGGLDGRVGANLGSIEGTADPLGDDEGKGAPEMNKAFAFPHQGKEPLTDAKHVCNAVACFNQVESVTDARRDAAWRRIEAAARRFNVDLTETDWRELPHRGRRSNK
jgi:hypothetical protein